MALLIVPASRGEALSHFEKTVAREWSVEDLDPVVGLLSEAVVQRLREAGSFRIWGAIPGSIGADTWRNIEGYVVAFYQDGHITCWGRVFAKVHSRRLAEWLWGVDERGRTWEYVYFIKDLKWCRIPWGRVKAELGYHEKFTLLGEHE